MMKRPSISFVCALMVAGSLPLAPAARSQAEDRSGNHAPAPPEARREIEALTARIAELEQAIAAARAAQGAPSPSPSTASPQAAALPPQAAAGVVSTAGAREAGVRAAPGAGDADEVKVLFDLFQRRDAPALTRELGRLLERGEAARATLYDFLSELDRDSREALLLHYDYHFSFSLVHLVILHEEELAKLAHYFLAATRNAPRSTLRQMLFDLLPELIHFRPGRYPDLQRDLEAEILRKLKEAVKDRTFEMQMYYNAMEALDFRPPIELFDPLLERASSHVETLPVALHLQGRNNHDAAEILSRNIQRTPPGMEWKASIMFNSLARMSAPEAVEAMARFVYHPDNGLRRAAVESYFGVPRDETSVRILKDFLDADVDLKGKEFLIHRLLREQPAVFEALKTNYDKLRPEVQEILRRAGVQPGR